jgi:hypothetical protein
MQRRLSARVLKQVEGLQEAAALVSSRTSRELAEMRHELAALKKLHEARIEAIERNWDALSKDIGKVVEAAASSVGIEDATPDELDEIYSMAPEAEGIGIVGLEEYPRLLAEADDDLDRLQKNVRVAEKQLEALDDFPTEIEVAE